TRTTAGLHEINTASVRVLGPIGRYLLLATVIAVLVGCSGKEGKQKSEEAAQPVALLASISADRPFEVRPRKILYTGDGTGRLTNLVWPSWTQRHALGSGLNVVNDCNPSCAQGTVHAFRVRVRASDARMGHFTRLIVLKGGTVVESRSLCHTTSAP